MAMREHDALEPLAVLAQPREVGQIHLRDLAATTWKHLPAVDEQDAIIVFDRHAVATHTTEATENYDTNGFGHRLTVLSPTDQQRAFKGALARALTNDWPVYIDA